MLKKNLSRSKHVGCASIESFEREESLQVCRKSVQPRYDFISRIGRFRWTNLKIAIVAGCDPRPRSDRAKFFKSQGRAKLSAVARCFWDPRYVTSIPRSPWPCLRSNSGGATLEFPAIFPSLEPRQLVTRLDQDDDYAFVILND